MGINVKRRWSTRMVNSRETHIALNGKTVGMDENFVTIAGNVLRYPGDPTAPAAEVINCYSQNCTNFVNQCLCAGGIPMFDGWARNFTGIPSSWDKGSWTLTNRTRCSLIAKGLITEIPYNQVQKGDIIFNYKASNSVHLRYPHVVIATGSYSAGKVPVHGHTENHKDWDKSINSTNCKCYRVVSGAPLEACEKLVTLPTTGSGATVN